MVKTSITMRDLARKLAIEAGPKIIETESGNKRVAYAISKKDLRILYENAGYNTQGVGWLKQITRWRILGEFVPADNVVLSKTKEDWQVCFLTLDEAQSWRLHSFAAHEELGDDKVIG